MIPDPREPLDLEPVAEPLDVSLHAVDVLAAQVEDYAADRCPLCGRLPEVVAWTESGFPRAFGEVLHKLECPLFVVYD